jgi:hypothetical protein
MVFWVKIDLLIQKPSSLIFQASLCGDWILKQNERVHVTENNLSSAIF